LSNVASRSPVQTLGGICVLLKAKFHYAINQSINLFVNVSLSQSNETVSKKTGHQGRSKSSLTGALSEIRSWFEAGSSCYFAASN